MKEKEKGMGMGMGKGKEKGTGMVRGKEMMSAKKFLVESQRGRMLKQFLKVSVSYHLPCLALHCIALPRPALPCPALPCIA